MKRKVLQDSFSVFTANDRKTKHQRLNAQSCRRHLKQEVGGVSVLTEISPSNSDPSGGGGAVDVAQCQVEAAMHPAAAAVTRRLQGDPEEAGQQRQSSSQEEERGGGGGSAAGGRRGGVRVCATSTHTHK